MFFDSAIIAALIALSGTLTVAYLGYRQWKKQNDSNRRADFLNEKQAAYKALWEKLEDVHVRLRTEDVDRAGFQVLLRETNALILKKQLFLEEEDRQLSNEYLKAVLNYTEIIRASDDDDARESMVTTGPLPRAVFEMAENIREATQEMDRLRDVILQRFREILGGTL